MKNARKSAQSTLGSGIADDTFAFLFPTDRRTRHPRGDPSLLSAIRNSLDRRQPLPHLAAGWEWLAGRSCPRARDTAPIFPIFFAAADLIWPSTIPIQSGRSAAAFGGIFGLFFRRPFPTYVKVCDAACRDGPDHVRGLVRRCSKSASNGPPLKDQSCPTQADRIFVE